MSAAREAQIFMLKCRCHAVDFASGKAVARRFIPPFQNGGRYFRSDFSRRSTIELEVPGNLQRK
ncbi:MAG: hypothetical protein EXQ55_09760 [Acidobacteria bacterium]|nr:hypothetical protein [Acidobacteriota bacterium]